MLSGPRRTCLLSAVGLLVWLAVARAQDSGPAVVDPRPLGIDLPPGPVIPGKGETVNTSDAEGQPHVGRVHARVGTGAVILLPDGQLIARTSDQFSPSDRKFEPLSKDDVVKRLAVEFPALKPRTTNHYVYISDASEEFTVATSRILETMLPGVKVYAERCGLVVQSPEFPLVVVIFRKEADFQKHRRMPAGVVAYYDTLTNRVFMYEQSRLAELRPDLAIQQAISTIAHEGAHQILHNIGVQKRLSIWPMWLGEGLAEYFAPTTTASRLRWKGAGQVNDLRMFELEQYLNSHSADDASGELVEHTVLAARLTSTGYAAAWALTHYLAKNRRSEFNELLREASRLEALAGAVEVTPPGVVRSNREQFVRLFGEDTKEMERRLILHLKKLPYTDPFLNAPHFVAMMVAGDGKRPERRAGTFHSRQLALKWLADTAAKLDAKERKAAQTSVRVFPNRTAAESYAKQWLQGR